MLFGLEIRGAGGSIAHPIPWIAVFIYGYGLILLACFIIGGAKRNAGAKPIWTSAGRGAAAMSSLKFIYFTFQGRIDRRTWWMAFVLIHLGIASFNYVLSKLMNDDAPFLDGTWPNLVRLLGDRSGWITAMVFLVPQLAINTKRFHDRGMSGWWWLVFLIPFLVATGISISSLGGEDYPSPLAGWAQLICGFTATWTLITLGFLPSKKTAAGSLEQGVRS